MIVLHYIRRYLNFLIIIWIFLGILWVVIDSWKIRRKEGKGIPPFVWTIVCLTASIWVIPIYWIARKPRQKVKIAIAVSCYWGFIILLVVFVPLSLRHRKSVLLLERQVLVKEINVGMTKERAGEILYPALRREFYTNSICTGDSNTWAFKARDGYYTLTFEKDTLRAISLSKDSP